MKHLIVGDNDPNNVLHTECKEIEFNSPEYKQTLLKIKEEMGRFGSKCAGLAAPQVGEPYRLSYINYRSKGGQRVQLTMLNPEIIETSTPKETTEMCISYPNRVFKTERFLDVRMKYTDHRGEEVVKTYDGFVAHCIQHEIDHLNGLTVDRFKEVTQDD